MIKRNSIVLFYPKTERENIMRNIPLALLKVGSGLAAAGYEVVIIDERFDEKYETRLKDILEKTLFFGVSVMTGYQIKGGLDASAFVKRIKKSIPIVWGGWHPSILPEETLENENIDIIVRGQGELTACELAEAIKEKRDLKHIDGISYKEGGKTISNRVRAFQDVNIFPSVRFDILEMGRYIFKNPLGERSIFWNSSQGCPYQCGFCSTPSVYCRRWSGLRAETLLDQIKSLVCDYGIDGITFAEDNFFVDVKRIEKLCRGLIKDGINIKWATDARVDQLNHFSDEFLNLLKESGCRQLFIGAESGDEEVLSLIDKRINLNEIYEVADKLDRHKVISEFYIIVGFPLNPKKDLEKSLELMKRIKSRHPSHQFTPFLYTPYPGTPLLDLAVKNGLEIPKTLDGWTKWSILSVSTPWVNKKYLDKVNMYSKCFYPLAFPSVSLRKKIEKRFTGLPYRILHNLARARTRKNFFLFPLEWKLVKAFYRIKVKFNLFKNIESFR